MGRAGCGVLFGQTEPNVAYANGFELAKYPMRFRIAHLATLLFDYLCTAFWCTARSFDSQAPLTHAAWQLTRAFCRKLVSRADL